MAQNAKQSCLVDGTKRPMAGVGRESILSIKIDTGAQGSGDGRQINFTYCDTAALMITHFSSDVSLYFVSFPFVI